MIFIITVYYYIYTDVFWLHYDIGLFFCYWINEKKESFSGPFMFIFSSFQLVDLYQNLSVCVKIIKKKETKKNYNNNEDTKKKLS